MTKEQAVSEMKDIAIRSAHDPEAAHGTADRLLCEVLVELGYKDLVDQFKQVEKWYA